MKIDAHHHFWKYDAAEYPWINDTLSEIRRDFLPADLWREIEPIGIEGVVSVQARQSLEETKWLLDQAERHSFVKGVVGWVPLATVDAKSHLDAFSSRAILKGIRHVVQDEPDERFLFGDDFNAGVRALANYGLVYDILIYERQLPAAIEFVDRHPQQIFVLDHMAKPRVKEAEIEPWRTNIVRIAERDNVYCKISGLVTEADWRCWKQNQLAQFMGTVLDAFGPRRVMFGSDWPVCLLASSYAKWYEVVTNSCAGLTASEQARVFGGTAAEAYRL